jgi:hypothetical protein
VSLHDLGVGDADHGILLNDDLGDPEILADSAWPG